MVEKIEDGCIRGGDQPNETTFDKKLTENNIRSLVNMEN